MKTFFQKFILVVFDKEIDALVEARVGEVRSEELRSFREIVRTRRSVGTPSGTPILAIIHLINEVERMERLKNGYADIVWDLVRPQPPEEVAEVKKRVGKLEGMNGLPPFGG